MCRDTRDNTVTQWTAVISCRAATLIGFTLTQTFIQRWVAVAMEGPGSPIGSNCCFSVLPKDTSASVQLKPGVRLPTLQLWVFSPNFRRPICALQYWRYAKWKLPPECFSAVLFAAAKSNIWQNNLSLSSQSRALKMSPGLAASSLLGFSPLVRLLLFCSVRCFVVQS